MKLLLHTCCAPCALSCIDAAKKDGFDDITLFFYNPNIQPGTEHKRRLNEVNKIVADVGARLIAPLQCTEYNPAEFFNNVKDLDETKKRCPLCWHLRLSRTADFAKDNGFDAFTSTLLSSPYQEHEVLKEICSGEEQRTNVKFYYSDFRLHFRSAHDEARKMGIYCQNYCGCVFSMVERFIKK